MKSVLFSLMFVVVSCFSLKMSAYAQLGDISINSGDIPIYQNVPKTRAPITKSGSSANHSDIAYLNESDIEVDGQEVSVKSDLDGVCKRLGYKNYLNGSLSTSYDLYKVKYGRNYCKKYTYKINQEGEIEKMVTSGWITEMSCFKYPKAKKATAPKEAEAPKSDAKVTNRTLPVVVGVIKPTKVPASSSDSSTKCKNCDPDKTYYYVSDSEGENGWYEYFSPEAE